MNTTQILTKARALIADPNHWTINCSARNKQGDPTSPFSASACKWCAMGAIRRTIGRERDSGELSDNDRAAFAALARGCKRYDPRRSSRLPFCWISEANDQEGHASILEAFDKAIALSA